MLEGMQAFNFGAIFERFKEVMFDTIKFPFYLIKNLPWWIQYLIFLFFFISGIIITIKAYKSREEWLYVHYD